MARAIIVCPNPFLDNLDLKLSISPLKAEVQIVTIDGKTVYKS
jgi:hypothetical protein